MTQSYTFVERAPTIEEYRALCQAVGWNLNFAAAPVSLRNSLFSVVVEHNGAVIGMGRVIGDGAMYCYIQDVAIRPDHQRAGLGRQILERLIGYVRSRDPLPVFVGLFAAPGTEPWYEQLGFRADRGLTGMFQMIDRGD